MWIFSESKKQIDTDTLEEAFLDTNPENKYYLDIGTGRVEKEFTDEEETNGRYFEIPKLKEEEIIDWMLEFARELVPFESPEFADKLEKEIKEGKKLKELLKLLEKDRDGWIHGWAQWRHDNVFEEIVAWFDKLPFDIEDDMSELDDDCPLCRMMKEGVTDFETIRTGFIEANAKQAIEDLHKNEEKSKNNDED